MVRRASRIDANQPEIVQALRDGGAVVELHHAWPCGYDVLCHYAGQSVRVEIKDGSKPPSAQKLTDREREARDNNPATYAVVRDVPEALGLLQSMREHQRLLSLIPSGN